MASKTSNLLPQHIVDEIRRMYAERGPNGRQLHTHESLAAFFGVGETTVRRIVMGIGRYAASKGHAAMEEALMAGAENTPEVQASLERLLKELKPAADLAKLEAESSKGD